MGQGISQIGDRIYLIALMWWTWDQTGSSAVMGLVMICAQIPVAILGPVAGYFADIWPRRSILIVADAVRGVVSLALCVLLYTDLLSIWVLLVATVLLNAATAFFNPTLNSIIPELVARHQLSRANAMTQFAESMAGTLGPSLGGMLYTVLRAGPMFLANSISFFAAAIATVFVRYEAPARPSGAVGERVGAWRGFRDGMRLVWRFAGVKESFFLIAFLNFFSHSSISVLLVVYVDRALHASAALSGLALSAFAVGNFAAVVLQSVWVVPARARFGLFVVCLMVQSLARAALGPVVDGVFLVVVFGVCGVANALINIIILTVLQLAIPTEQQGKAFGVVQTLCWGLSPLAMGLFGVLGEVFAVPLIFAVANLLSAGVSLLYLTLPGTRILFGVSGRDVESEGKAAG